MMCRGEHLFLLAEELVRVEIHLRDLIWLAQSKEDHF